MALASELIFKQIADLVGASAWFGIAGANIEVLMAAAIQGGANLTIAKHEFGAGCMADAAAKLTGRPACVLVTSGAGALNVMPALAESFSTRTPVLAIVGDIPLAARGTGAFQETSGLAGTFDIADLFKPISRYCRRILSRQDWIDSWSEARCALQGQTPLPTGPVVLIIPRDVQNQIWDEFPAPPAITHPSPHSPLSGGEMRSWVERLREAGQSALLVVGDEVVRAQAGGACTRIAEALNCAIAVTAGAKGAISTRHPLFVGILGAAGHAEVSSTLEKNPLLWIIGSRLASMDRFGVDGKLNGCTAVTWASENSHIPQPLMQSVIIQDLGTALSEVAAALTEPAKTYTARAPEALFDTQADPIRLSQLASAFTSLVARPEITVVADAGNAAAAVTRDLHLSRGSDFLIALGMGGMGYSFGAAIGAVIATGRPAVVFAGDGSFYMHGMEIHTAIQKQLPILFVILDNHAHAMCVTRDALYLGLKKSPSLFGKTSLGDGLSAMFPSLLVHNARTIPELMNAVEDLRSLERTSALVVELRPEEFPPFLPFQGVQT